MVLGSQPGAPHDAAALRVAVAVLGRRGEVPARRDERGHQLAEGDEEREHPEQAEEVENEDALHVRV